MHRKISEVLKTKDNKQLSGVYETIKTLFNTMSIFQEKPDKFLYEIKSKYIKKYNLDTNYINELIQKRQELRDSKQYDLADEIKMELLDMGLLLSDTKDSTEWDIDFDSKKNNSNELLKF